MNTNIVNQINSLSNNNISLNENSSSSVEDDGSSERGASPSNGSLADFNVCHSISNNNNNNNNNSCNSVNNSETKTFGNSNSNLSRNNSTKSTQQPLSAPVTHTRNTLDLRNVKKNFSSAVEPFINGVKEELLLDKEHEADRLQFKNHNNKLEQNSVNIRINNDCDSKIVNNEIVEDDEKNDDDENFHLENGDELSDNSVNELNSDGLSLKFNRKTLETNLTENSELNSNNNNSLFNAANPKRTMDNVLRRLTSKMRGSSLGDTKRLQEQQLAAAAAAVFTK
jgi:hypothetical protein